MKSLYSNFLIAKDIHTSAKLFKETAKNLKGKKHSSQLWLTRQLKDPYVEKSKKESYRCRSAFKLLEINERFKILKPGQTVIDCGAAPGSWTQVAIKMTNANGKHDGDVGTVIGIDKIPMYPIKGATLLGNMDFTNITSQKELLKLLKDEKAHVVLSDMAPNASGIKAMDHENIIKLAYTALKFALQITCLDGTFVCKVWDGEKSQQLEKDLLKFFKHVRNVRPEATRDESTEKFFLATGFKGIKTTSSSTL
ncbi:mitochondrial rRNA methyltransferase 2 [Osmia lignaria lignaria]|uniref:mitochondrial rRNA methyltransferase 2 n=1 Tax=Osmia lignaria lignaria TaxID=1437193 RepID=UPI0014781F0E|nr:rRNA methyltransferase 2, mitochondrial [Osmia lignaria]